MRRMLLCAAAFFVFFCAASPLRAVAEETSDTDRYIQDILEELDISALDESTYLKDEKLSFSDLAQTLISGDTDKSSGRMITEYIYDLFFYEISAIKPLLLQLISMSLIFSIFGKAVCLKNDHVSEMGFFVVYTGIMLLLLESFATVGDVAKEGINAVSSFMSAFVPTYAAVLFMTGNAASAGVFYEITFSIIYVADLCLKFIFLPGIHYFVLILFLDDLRPEKRLSKLAALFEDGMKLVLKAGTGAVAGLGVVQSLVVPAQDFLTANSVYKGLSALPGVGNSFGAAADLIAGCAVVVRNGLGAAALIVLAVVSLTPVIKIFSYSLMYRIAAAALEPFCDSRISDCVHDVGRGCALYLRLILTELIYFWITTALITAGTSFIN